MKKGVSGIAIATFLILITLLFVALLFVIVKNYTLKSKPQITCLIDVDLSIKSSCYENNTLKITLKNNKDIELGRFLKIVINYEDGTAETRPTPPNTNLKSFETKEIFITIQEKEIDNIFVIPRIESLEGEQAFCAENAPEFKPQPC